MCVRTVKDACKTECVRVWSIFTSTVSVFVCVKLERLACECALALCPNGAFSVTIGLYSTCFRWGNSLNKLEEA